MSIAFDTLGATKRLREAGLEERAAEAIVELVQSSAQFPDIGGLATKADTATKADLANMATKADLADLAHTTRMDIQALKADLAITKHQILAELNDKLRFQGLALMGGMTAIVGLATAIIKLGS
jgi:hypothetical protein